MIVFCSYKEAESVPYPETTQMFLRFISINYNMRYTMQHVVKD